MASEALKQLFGVRLTHLNAAKIDFVEEFASEHSHEQLVQEIRLILGTLVENGWTRAQLLRLSSPSSLSSSSSSAPAAAADSGPLFPACVEAFGSPAAVEVAMRVSKSFGTNTSNTHELQHRLRGELSLERQVVAVFVDSAFRFHPDFHLACNTAVSGSAGKQPDLSVSLGGEGRVVLLGEDKESDKKGTDDDFLKCLRMGREQLLNTWNAKTKAGYLWQEDKFPLYIVLFTGGKFSVLLMTLKNPEVLEAMLEEWKQRQQPPEEEQDRAEVSQVEAADEKEDEEAAAPVLVPPLDGPTVDMVRKIKGCEEIEMDWNLIVAWCADMRDFTPLLGRLPRQADGTHYEFVNFAQAVVRDSPGNARALLLQYLWCSREGNWSVLFDLLLKFKQMDYCSTLESAIPEGYRRVLKTVQLNDDQQRRLVEVILNPVSLDVALEHMRVSNTKASKIRECFSSGGPLVHVDVRAKLQRVVEGHVGDTQDAMKLLVTMGSIVKRVKEYASFAETIPPELAAAFSDWPDKQHVRTPHSKSPSPPAAKRQKIE